MNIKTIINLKNEINAIHQAYNIKLGFYTKKIDIGIQKIDKLYLNVFEMIIVEYLVENKLERVKFL